MKKVSLSFKLVEGSRNHDGQFVQYGKGLSEDKVHFFSQVDLLAWVARSREVPFKYIEVSTVFFSRSACDDGRAFDELTVLARLLP